MWFLTHAGDLLDSKPMQDIWHYGLEAHILLYSYVFCALEVFAGFVLTSLPSIVDQVLGNLAESASFLSEVDNNATPSFLSLLDGLLDTEDEIRAASAYVGTEDITSVAFVMNS